MITKEELDKVIANIHDCGPSPKVCDRCGVPLCILVFPFDDKDEWPNWCGGCRRYVPVEVSD